MELEEDQDLDFDAGAKLLRGEDGLSSSRKKPKARAKSKKAPKEDGEAILKTSKAAAASTLPLSMQEARPEDVARYEQLLGSQKTQIAAAREYNPATVFKPGDAMKHKTFGIGFVVVDSGLGKVEVLFSVGRKLLLSGRPL